METLVEHGPLLEQGMLTAGIDYYKPTMSQLAYENEREAEVTFEFKNRGKQRMLDYVDPAALQSRFDLMRDVGFSDIELDFLAEQKTTEGDRLFSNEYLDFLKNNELPQVRITHDEETNDIAIQTTGDFPIVTFWETIVMSEVNEAYFEGYVRAHDLDLNAIYEEGDRRLSEKIAILQANPDIKFAEFGNRRRFSLRWQKHVDERLVNECPGNLIGISNIALARANGVAPSGTMAHEMFMVYAALADSRGQDVRASHGAFLGDWVKQYDNNLSVALTDTFGSEFFFSDMTLEQAEQWNALRHDSGDPVEFGERVIEFYENLGIDPKTKTIVFSDGLDISTIIKLHGHFKDHVNLVFGWGTTLTNDLGLKPLNIVMKATEVNGTKTVKLSDNEGKHTGPTELIERYKTIFGAVKNEACVC